MKFHILGPLQVMSGGAPVSLGGRRQSTTLAVLLANAGQVVPLEYLIDAVWDDRPPATAKRQIQNYVSALRRLLAGGRAGDPGIVADGPGYRVVAEPDDLDSLAFAERVAAAVRAAADDRPAEAVAGLRSALDLWRGPALMGLAGRAVEAAANRLEEQRLVAVEHLFDLELKLGRQQAVLGELAELVTAHPLRERFVGQLMLALHRSGRQAEAEQVYQRLRGQLADELGLDPGIHVRQLHAAILRDAPEVSDPAPAAVRATVAPPPVPAPAVPAQLPAQLPAEVAGFTGRAEQLARLDELLAGRDGDDPAAVTIAVVSGMAGVGKTALAVHWGHRVRDRFPDGQLYLDLRGYADAEPVGPFDALVHLLRSLGEPPERIPADVQTAAGRYRSLTSARRLLVVLDNAAGADQLRPLLPGGAGCLVLVTSRDRLTGLRARDGAHGLDLDVLTPQEAGALLARLIGGAAAGADEPVAELAAACSRLPLALRVAAANVTNHDWPSVADYLAALRGGDRIAALEIDGDELAGVRSAFDLSYRALDPAARRVFRLLSLVPGPDVTAEAAAALAGTTAGDARQQLSRLAAAHLVNRSAPRRYAYHDLLREYAAGRARAEDTPAQRGAALDRLHGWYLAGADAAAGVLYRDLLRLPVPPLEAAAPAGITDSTTALAWLDAERPNLVAAVRHAAEHGPPRAAWLLADALRGYFWLRMHTADWEHAARAALVAAERGGDARARAAALLSVGDLHFRRSQPRQAIESYAAALPPAERSGWTGCQAALLGNLGVAHRESGSIRDAVRYLCRARDLFRAAGSRYALAVALDALAVTYWQAGRPAEATGCGMEAVSISRAIGSRLAEATSLAGLGLVLHSRGMLPEAGERLAAARALFRELGDRTNEASVLRALAQVECDRGRHDAATRLARDALARARDLGDRRIEADATNVLGTVEHRLGRHPWAVRHHRRAVELARAAGSRFAEAEALIGCAAASAATAEARRAVEDAHAALAIAREAGYRLLEERAAAVLRRLPAALTCR